ncbi:MAG: hypothetical protein HC854_13555 [Flavobacterium sp.]|nr:hypothetical protein [Flavobacterium sp.]
MVFEIIEEVNILMNGFQKEVKTRFNIDFSLFNKTEDERIYIINKEKINSVPVQESAILRVIEQLESLNYPIKIKTDYKGHFVGIHEHEKWLTEWDKRADELIDKEFSSFDKAKEIKAYYFDIIKDVETFEKINLKNHIGIYSFLTPKSIMLIFPILAQL